MAGNDPLAGASADLADAASAYTTNALKAEADAKQRERQANLEAQRRAQQAALFQQQQGQSWYGTLLDRVWMDDFQQGPFGQNNGLANAWKEGIGDKVNAATTTITKGYDSWSQVLSYGVAALPGGVSLTWDQARDYSVGQMSLMDAAARRQQMQTANPFFRAAYDATLSVAMPWQNAAAKLIEQTDPSNPLNDMSTFTPASKGEAFSGVGMWASGIPDAVASFYLDPLVIGGKALKVARFGSTVTNWAGLTNRQLTTRRNLEVFGTEVDAALAHIDDPLKPRSNVNEHAEFLARATREELEKWHILDDTPYKDIIVAIGAPITDVRDAAILLGALGGNAKYVGLLRDTQHSAFDALVRAKNISAHEQAMMSFLNEGDRAIPAVLDDVAEANVRAEALLTDLTKRDQALRSALGVVDHFEGTPLIQNIGSKSARYERFRNAWNAGEANRTPDRLGGEATRMSVWDQRANETSFLDAETFAREGRVTAEDAARIKRAEDLRPGSGPAGTERVYRASSALRPVRVWSWATGEKASGYIDVKGIGVGNQNRELAAAFSDSATIRKDAVFQQTLQQIWDDALVSGSPEARMQAVKTIERSVTTYLANKHGADAAVMDEIYKALDARRYQVVNQFNSSAKRTGRAYGVNPDDGSLIALDPIFSSQLETKMPMLDFNILERSAKIAARPEYRGLKLAEDRILAENLIDEVASLWKASVLLRLGYTQRNVMEGWLRTAAVLGSIPALAYSPKAAKNILWDNRAWSGRGRAAARYELEQKYVGANLRATREQIRAREQEMFDYTASRNSFASETMADLLEARANALDPYQRVPSQMDRQVAYNTARQVLTDAGEVSARTGRPTQAAIKKEAARIMREEVRPTMVKKHDPTAGVYRLRALSARTQTPNYARRGGTTVKIGGSRIEAKAVFAPSPEARRIMKDHGISPETFYEITDGQAFAKAINSSKASNPFGASVTAYAPDQYASMRLFLSGDGKVGFAIKDGDEIVSAFSPKGRAAGHSIKRLSIEQGGRRSDAFDTVLPDIYTPHGMRPMGRTRFNPNYAPEGWDYSVYSKFKGTPDDKVDLFMSAERHGMPDVVSFAYDPNYVSTYRRGDGIMYEGEKAYDDMVDAATEATTDSTLSQMRAEIDALRQSENRLVTDYQTTVKMRAKYGKRKLGDDAAFAGANGNLYRNLSSNKETNERVLESAWGRQAERSMNEKNWVLVKPDEPQYFDELSRSVQQMQNDSLATLAIQGKSQTEMRAWLSTPEGRDYARTMNLTGRKELDARVSLVHDMVNDYLPTKAARELASDPNIVPSGTELQQMLVDTPIPLKPIHGRSVNELLGGQKTVNEVIHQPINWLFEKLGTIPETVLVRQPFYNKVWTSRYEALMRDAKRQYGTELTDAQLQAIEQNAHAFALKAVNDTLYTIQRYSNPANALRFVAPFFPAWENSMRVWAGIVLRDPSVAVRASMLWQIPNKMGLVTDEKGNKVESDPFAFGTGSINRYIQFPKALSDVFKKASESTWADLPGVGGALRAMGEGSFRVPQGSLNVVSPGQTPWLPGFGPMVVAPVGMYLASKPDQQAFLRKFLGDALYQQIAPFGVASGDLTDTVLPPAVRKMFQRWEGESNREYLQVVDALMRTAMTDWYESGSAPEDMPSPDSIRQKANDFFLFSTLASLTLPVSISRTSKYQVEIDEWNNLKATPGLTYAEKVEQFLTLHGESYLPLITSSSGSASKDIDPTLETWNVLNDNTGLVEKLAGLGPEAIGILGASAPLGQFDQGTYNYWLNTDIPGQPGLKYKATLSPTEMQERIQLSGAWREYNQFKAQRDAALAARGGMTMEAAVNADIKDQWTYTTDVYLRAKYGPAWTVAFNDYQGNTGKYLEGIQAVLDEPSFTQGNTQLWATIRQYMDVRAQAMQAIQSGVDDKSVKDQFAAWAGELRFTSLEFADFFDNYLANDQLTIGVN